MSAPRPMPEVLAREAGSCACPKCQAMCKRSCWPTPAEAARLLDAGYAKKLMADWWEGDERIYLLCGATPGNEGRDAPEIGWFGLFGSSPLHRGCVFQDAQTKRCELHEPGLKPIEGRLADHDWPGNDNALHEAVAATWNTDEGRAVVARWRELVS